MKILNICGDGTILNIDSDARFRMIDYGKIVDEYHIQIFSNIEKTEKISSNVWVYSIKEKPIIKWFKQFLICRSIIKVNKIDCIISPGPYASGFVASFLKMVYRTKYLLSIYASNIYDTYWVGKSLIRLLYRYTIGPIPFLLADAIQTDGEETLADLRERFGEKVFLKVVVPKNIDKFISEEKLINLTAKTTFIFIGRMTGQKNLYFLSKVINFLKPYRDICFKVVGDGRERKKFISMNKEMINLGRLVCLQKLSRAEIVDLYKGSDVLLLTSLYEGFPRVFMEAAAIGMPIITTRVSGVRNLLKDGVGGFVVAQGDFNSFIQKIIILHNDHRLISELGRSLKNSFVSKYSYQLTIDQQKIIFNYLKKL